MDGEFEEALGHSAVDRQRVSASKSNASSGAKLH
jgi:hypothetical protein